MNLVETIKANVATEIEAVVLPEGVEVTQEVKQLYADAGVKATLTGLAAKEEAPTLADVNELITSYFADINS